MLHNQYFLASLLLLTLMNTFINNFKIQERICHSCHPPTPCRWIVVKESQMSIACRQCYVNKNSVNQGAQIYSIDGFYANFRNLVTQQKEQLNKISQFNLKKVIQQKKNEFEQKQFRFIEELTHKLNEIKDSFFMHLDMCQSTYQKEADARQTYLSEIKELIEYLDEFSENPQLLKFKLAISNQTGLNEFYSQLIRLRVLKQHYKNENYQSFISNVTNNLNSKLKQNILIFSKMHEQFNQLISSNCTKKVELVIKPQLKLKSYSNMKTQRTNQSSQNISRNYTPRSKVSSQSFSSNLPIK